MKRYISTFILTALVAVFMVSCGNGESTEKDSKGKQKGEATKPAEAVFGGELTVCEGEKYQTLFPLSIVDVSSAHIASQIYEGLLKFDPTDLSLKPSLAESWEVDETGKVYTFNLKKGVHFHDDPCFDEGEGRELTARDVKYTFEQICTQSPYNFTFASTFKDKLKGANEYYKASKDGKPDFDLAGVKVIDDYTVEITLTKPHPSFLNVLAAVTTAIVPEEGVEQYGEMLSVGTGPFMYEKSDKPEKYLKLVRNENYHQEDKKGNQLPYLDAVNFKFINSKNKQLSDFKKNRLDIVLGLPAESIKEMVEDQISKFQSKPPKYILERSPEMATQYYEFNTTREAFRKVKVRRAISYAIDRKKIIDKILRGEAYGPGIHGITPPTFEGYDITKIAGYDFNPEKAEKLLAEAGYPGGKGFPDIQLKVNDGGSKNAAVALEIQKQLLGHLNLNVNLEVMSLAEKIEDAKYGKGDMFRSGWVADYPSPENFLLLLYGAPVPESLDEPSFPNVSRYNNPEFNQLFEKARTTQSQEKAYELYMEAEKKAMQDAPVLVLWYSEKYRLTQSYVHNFTPNPMNLRDFTTVFINKSNVDEEAKEAKAKK